MSRILQVLMLFAAITSISFAQLSETAGFPLGIVSISVQSSPAGRMFTVDGVPYTSAQTYSWTSGSSHSIATTSPQSGGTGIQYVFGSWSDGGGISHIITTPSSNTTYTANFSTQYVLTMNNGTGGTVSPVSGWQNSGQSVQITASTNSGYKFTGWTGSGTGSYTGLANPASVTMNGVISETASFAVATSVADYADLPGTFCLDQNYPNPFNPSTTIRYALPNRSHVTLSVYNTLGQQVGTLVDETQEAGYHEVRFDGSGLASGVYFYRLQAGIYVDTKKLLLLK